MSSNQSHCLFYMWVLDPVGASDSHKYTSLSSIRRTSDRYYPLFKKVRPHVSGMFGHSRGDLFRITSNFLHGFIKRGPVNSFHMTCCCNPALKITFLPVCRGSRRAGEDFVFLAPPPPPSLQRPGVISHYMTASHRLHKYIP